MGTEGHYFICDVANREEVYRQAKAVREKVGDVTILVNNAAVVHGKTLLDSDDHALLKSQHINTLGQFWTTKAFLPRMLELQRGHIVCLNSVLALSAIPGAVDYCTSKASSFAFMESLTLGLLDCPGVNATTVLPFHTSTEMFQGIRISWLSSDSWAWRTHQGQKEALKGEDRSEWSERWPWVQNSQQLCRDLGRAFSLGETHKAPWS
ncbi:putative Short-chain dehydrogenase-reductase 3 protein [Naja naja]|nr:putative Short-chain dehydrogenase-reductase 3 protein [Naja naja]